MVDTLTWVWYTKLKKYVYILMSILFAAFSIAVLLGELDLFLDVNLSIFEVLIYKNSSYFSILV